jgi:hypothetical protein
MREKLDSRQPRIPKVVRHHLTADTVSLDFLSNLLSDHLNGDKLPKPCLPIHSPTLGFGGHGTGTPLSVPSKATFADASMGKRIPSSMIPQTAAIFKIVIQYSISPYRRTGTQLIRRGIGRKAEMTMAGCAFGNQKAMIFWIDTSLEEYEKAYPIQYVHPQANPFWFDPDEKRITTAGETNRFASVNIPPASGKMDTISPRVI